MNKKLMTMLVACALSVSALSTTAVFAEDAVVNGDTPAVTETTPASYEPEITLTTSKWTGDNDIVFNVDTKGGTVYTQEIYIYDINGAMPITGAAAKVEVNEEGKGKITFTKDVLKNAKTWDDSFENQISVDWTKINKIEFSFGFELDDQYESKTVYVEASVKSPEITVTPTAPSQPAKPSTPAKPAENRGTTTTTKKEAPKTGDTMNVALYASLLVVSALAAVVLTTKKKMAE
ncbi:LPXTG cell wall anchor domain-containing protein [uncultured Catenibacterium sp.]|uniref:LPXTG cell wall anchor domain-containing protein n=1 Tax=uncultured Catenibacterium sp. TaxID=286142 RepID=UPI0025E3E0E2|nr:LPXTG cell wall anchor domain-containing protein [uncultured Catenibacterium sp.]